MTEISAKQWNFITKENLTPKEAVFFLENGMQVRTFRDIIIEICGTADVEKQLLEGLCEISQIEGKNSLKDSVRKKISNWMNGKNIPSDRNDVFAICFALNLNLEQAEKMLVRLTEQGIHYRNRREVVYAYAYKYQIGYENAKKILETYFGDHKNSENVDYESNVREHEKSLTGKKEYSEPVTCQLKFEFKQIAGQEDLFSFLLAHKKKFGEKHNTAYQYFEKMVSLLTCQEVEDESPYSLEYIAENYLRLKMPYEKHTNKYTKVQKVIKKYWPGASMIKAMKARTEDVNRKTLLLLYLVTGGIMEEEYAEMDEDYMDATELLECHCSRMNQMLMECGMSTIDPRNIFDYLILYCMRPEQHLFMSERMELLIQEIFREL